MYGVLFSVSNSKHKNKITFHMINSWGGGGGGEGGMRNLSDEIIMLNLEEGVVN